jgi:hypothetical protein
MPAYTITNTKLLNVLLLCLSLVKNRNVIILFFTGQWMTSEDLQGRLLLKYQPTLKVKNSEGLEIMKLVIQNILEQQQQMMLNAFLV